MSLEVFLEPTNLIGIITVVINGVMIWLNYTSSRRQIRSIAILNNRQEEINEIRDNILEVLTLSVTFHTHEKFKTPEFLKRLEQISNVLENLTFLLNQEIDEEKVLLGYLDELKLCITSKDGDKDISKHCKNVRLQTKNILTTYKKDVQKI